MQLDHAEHGEIGLLTELLALTKMNWNSTELINLERRRLRRLKAAAAEEEGEVARMNYEQARPQAYFKTFSLENGPAILGIPTKKPHPKTLKSRGGKVDEDGVWNLLIEDHESLGVYELKVKHLVYSTIATDINVKRALRRQVEPALNAMARDLAALKEQLDRIERKLDAGARQ